MAETLYATFHDPNRAKEAADELIGSGIQNDEISVLVKHHGTMLNDTQGVNLEDTRPTTPMRGTEFHHAFQPLGNDLRQLSVPEIQPGLDVEINPAQSDYPRNIAPPGNLSSAPPNAERDYNRGLESDNYNKDYDENALADMNRDKEMQADRRRETEEATPYEDMPPGKEGLRFSRGYNALAPGSPPDIKVDPDADAYRDADTTVRHNVSGSEVATDAAKGAGIGLGLGAVAALAVLLVPGLGIIIGAGPMAAAAAALAAGAGTGAAAGALTGLLEDQGLPRASIDKLNSVYDGGGAILAVTVRQPEMRETVNAILRKHGADGVESHQAYVS